MSELLKTLLRAAINAPAPSLDGYSVDRPQSLSKAGWVEDRVVGSHHIFKHPARPGHLTVAHPKKDLGKGLVHKIRKQAGLK